MIDLGFLRAPVIKRKRRSSYTNAGRSRDVNSISINEEVDAQHWKTLTDHQLVIANAAHPDDAEEEYTIHVRKMI